ncbi:MAG: DUF2914 domain-containing protein [Methylococcaceae bacterium]
MTGQARIIKKINGTDDVENVQTKNIRQALVIGEWSIIKAIVAVILLSIILVPIYIRNIGSYDVEVEDSINLLKNVNQNKEVNHQKDVNQDLDAETKIVVAVIDEAQDVQFSKPIENSTFKTEEEEKIIPKPEPKPGLEDSLNQKKDIKQVIAESVNDPYANMNKRTRKFKSEKTIDKNENEEKETLESRSSAEDSLNQKKDIKQVIADSVTKPSAKPVDNNENKQKEIFTRESFDEIYLDYNNDKKTRTLNKDTDLPLIKRNDEIVNNSQEYSKTTDKTIISRALLTNALIDREPVDNIISFVKVSRQKDTKINYFTEIMNMNGKVLYHQWLWEGQMEFNKKINIKGSRWRVSTKKFIPFSKPGTWLAKLVNEEGNILNEIKFEVIQK